MNPINILKELTVQEKASLCSGLTMWLTKPVKRLGIASLRLSDGPHGLRKEKEEKERLSVQDSEKATCFPPACTCAATWNVQLLHKMGEAIGAEAIEEDIAVVLGPGVNIKRSPLCGRNFEYFSEDPYLAGELAVAYVNGLQSKGVGASLKHFAANNQETYRMLVDAHVDERALREIYLSAFEKVVKKAKPWTIMSAYNRLNGVYCSDNHWLLTDVLREEWGFDGLVMTDWGAMNDRVEAIKAGCDLEMPTSLGINDEEIVRAIEENRLSEKQLDQCALRLLQLVEKWNETKHEKTCDFLKHHELARLIAAEGNVLLKNQGVLPFAKDQKLLIIGEFAEKPRYQGAGSSKINPTQLVSFLEILEDRGIPYEYCKGYGVENYTRDELLHSQAVAAAAQGGNVLIMAGLPAQMEAEGFDRTDMEMPEAYTALIQDVAAVNQNVAVYLSAGAPITMPWIDSIHAVVYGYLGGQAGAEAAADVLFGDISPSGKLPESFPMQLTDCPAKIGVDPNCIEYRESIFIGYRYYTTCGIKTRFPFGHGLSYTTFEYTNICVDGKTVRVKVQNTGKCTGSEVVQLYVHKCGGRVLTPQIELKGFVKIKLGPGEQKEVNFHLDDRTFAFYDTSEKNWRIEPGRYELRVGSSSEDIRLTANVELDGPMDFEPPVYYNREDVGQFPFEKIYQMPQIAESGEQCTMLTRLCEIKNLPTGRKIYADILAAFAGSQGMDKATEETLSTMIDDWPLRTIFNMCGQRISMDEREELLECLNRECCLD